MKRITNLLLVVASLAISILSYSPAHAQIGTSGNSVVTVTVTDILALVVAVPAVPLAMGVATDYSAGTSFVAPAQLTASSNRPYDIKVISGGDLTGQGTANR